MPDQSLIPVPSPPPILSLLIPGKVEGEANWPKTFSAQPPATPMVNFWGANGKLEEVVPVNTMPTLIDALLVETPAPPPVAALKVSVYPFGLSIRIPEHAERNVADAGDV
jgi:hypothetical protein